MPPPTFEHPPGAALPPHRSPPSRQVSRAQSAEELKSSLSDGAALRIRTCLSHEQVPVICSSSKKLLLRKHSSSRCTARLASSALHSTTLLQRARGWLARRRARVQVRAARARVHTYDSDVASSLCGGISSAALAAVLR